MFKTTPKNTAKSKQLEISIYSVIGDSWWDEDTVSAIDVKKLLDAGGFDEILVRINSPGGNAYDGIAIYNLLAQRQEKVIVEIDGVALSAASIVAMAGDEIRMAANALLMIHCAWTIVLGNSQELAKQALFLEKLDQGLAKTYAARSNGDLATINQQMVDETWFTADEAKAAGLCDVVVPAKEASAAFDLSVFKNVPQSATERFGAKHASRFSIAAGPMPLEQLFPSMSFKDESTMSKPNETPQPVEQPAAPPAAPQNQPPAAPPVAPVDAAKIASDATAAAKAAEKERSSKILALCGQAGKPDQALAFIEGDLSVVDVQAKLFDSMCKDRTPIGEEGSSTIVPNTKDADAEAKQQYKANPHLAKVMTEEEFVAQKKRDEDHGYVVPKSVAKALAGAN